jgi:hypothetical protein
VVKNPAIRTLFCENTLALKHLAAWIGRVPMPSPGVFRRWFGFPRPEESPDEAGSLKALDVATIRASLVRGSAHPSEQLVASPNRDLTGFGPFQGLRVVRGMAMTVFPTEGAGEQILKRHPALAHTGPSQR